MGLLIPSIYRHIQATAADTWTIVHNLGGGEGQVPMVDIMIDVDGTFSKMIPLGVAKIDANTVSVTFTSARAGKATVIV